MYLTSSQFLLFLMKKITILLFLYQLNTVESREIPSSKDSDLCKSYQGARKIRFPKRFFGLDIEFREQSKSLIFYEETENKGK